MLRELRALPPERPPRGLALVMGLVTALVLIAGTVALAVAAPPGPGPPLRFHPRLPHGSPLHDSPCLDSPCLDSPCRPAR